MGKETKKTASNSFGDYLKAIRLGKKMTLRHVEEATGKEVSNAYLSQLENGKIAKPSPHILYALSRVYNVSYESLMEMAGYIMSSKTAHEEGTKHGKAATLSIDNLTADEQKEILEYIAFILQKRKK